MKINHQIIEYTLLSIAGVVVVAALISLVLTYRNKVSFEKRWKDLQKLLVRKSTWKEAVIQADKLLDEMLKKRHFRGKTMGERLVAAQHELSANEQVWYSHKLKNKLDSDPRFELTKNEVKKSLLGVWLALKDLGAFKKHD